MASHHPWDIIDNKGEMHENVTPYENNKWVIGSIVKWINWMKDNEVYDNTKIILVSDHGPHWRHFKGEVDNDIPIILNPSLNIDMVEVMGMYSLLLVKDFNKTEYLKNDMRFMSNADVSNIAFNRENITTMPPRRRILPYTMVNWTRKIGLKKEIKVTYKIEADNSAFDMNKWKRVN